MVAAADIKVNKLMKSVEAACTEEQVGGGFVQGSDPRFNNVTPNFIVRRCIMSS